MAEVMDAWKSGVQSIGDDAFLDCQPAADHEIIVHNVYHEDDIEVEDWDGANFVSFASEADAGVLAHWAFHCTNTKYIRIKNVAGATKKISADGVYSRVA